MEHLIALVPGDVLEICKRLPEKGKRGWIVGDSGVVLGTRDGGSTWSLYQTPTKRALYGLSVAPPAAAVSVGESGAIVRTDDGERWTEIAIRFHSAPLSVFQGTDVTQMTSKTCSDPIRSDTAPWTTGTTAPPTIAITSTAPPVSWYRLSSTVSRVCPKIVGQPGPISRFDGK